MCSSTFEHYPTLLESVAKMIQKETVTLSQVRSLFDAEIEKFPSAASRLEPKASIAHSPILSLR